MHQISNQIGCRPVYWGHKSNLSIRSTKTKTAMLEKYFIDRYFGSNQSASYIPRCLEIESIHDSHPETIDSFKFGLWFRSNRFMEIKQVKAYHFHSLVGNGGGIVGLFLGYSIIQLPSMIMSYITVD